MDKKRIKYMFNPEYLKKYVKYKVDLNKIDIKYNKRKQLLDESIIPDKLTDVIDDKLLRDRNDKVVETSENFMEEVAPIEKDINIKLNVIKRLIKERMSGNGKI